MASKAAVEPNPVVADFVRMFLVNWFYGILNSLGLAMKSGKSGCCNDAVPLFCKCCIIVTVN